MQVENFQKLMDTVAQIDEQGRKAVKATVRDVKARAPSWIAQEVTSVYNIKKGEITPSGKNSSKPKKMAGSVSVSHLHAPSRRDPPCSSWTTRCRLSTSTRRHSSKTRCAR